jgi:hypothetical protein
VYGEASKDVASGDVVYEGLEILKDGCTGGLVDVQIEL